MHEHDDTLQTRIDTFLDGSPFAVVGASTDRAKYGNKVLRVYQQHGREVYPVNPKGGEIEGLAAFTDLRSLTEHLGGPPHGVSIITPPAVTEQVMRDAAELGIKHAWMQPGAELEAAVQIGRDAGMGVIAGDACLLVVLGFRDS